MTVIPTLESSADRDDFIDLGRRTELASALFPANEYIMISSSLLSSVFIFPLYLLSIQNSFNNQV